MRIMIFFLLFVVVIGAVFIIVLHTNTENTEIQHIAYDSRLIGRPRIYTVYIEEYGELTPYLVLTQNYQQTFRVLLLRKYLLSEPMMFHRANTTRYDSSELDLWLDSAFLERFNDDILSLISLVNIEMWDGETNRARVPIRRGSYRTLPAWENTVLRPRRAFILSYSELGLRIDDLAPDEGQTLAYFRNNRHRRARHIDDPEQFQGYWTRSRRADRPSLFFGEIQRTANIGIVNSNGRASRRNWNSEQFVRPAFVMPRDTPIERHKMEDGRVVYIIPN